MSESALEFIGTISKLGVGLAKLGLMLSWVGLGDELVLLPVGRAVLLGCLSRSALGLLFSQAHV